MEGNIKIMTLDQGHCKKILLCMYRLEKTAKGLNEASVCFSKLVLFD